jgi:hypothetical protein
MLKLLNGRRCLLARRLPQACGSSHWRGLRALVKLNSDKPPENSAISEMRRSLEGLNVIFHLDDRGHLSAVAKGNPFEQAAGKMVMTVHRSMIDGTWGRMKVCKNDACLLAFYDHSRSRTGKWCSMSECGNRIKVKRYLSKRKVKARSSKLTSRLSRGRLS